MLACAFSNSIRFKESFVLKNDFFLGLYGFELRTRPFSLSTLRQFTCPSSCRWQFGLKLRLLYLLYYQAWDLNILFKIKTPAHSQAVQGYAGSIDDQILIPRESVCTYVLCSCWTRTRNTPLRWYQPCSNWNLMACWHNLAVVTVSKDTQVVVNLVNSLSQKSGQLIYCAGNQGN